MNYRETVIVALAVVSGIGMTILVISLGFTFLLVYLGLFASAFILSYFAEKHKLSGPYVDENEADGAKMAGEFLFSLFATSILVFLIIMLPELQERDWAFILITTNSLLTSTSFHTLGMYSARAMQSRNEALSM